MDLSKRMHPLMIPVSYIKSLKNTFFIFFILFIINLSNDAMWVKIGRILFIVYLVYALFSIILKWWKTTYTLKKDAVEIEEGVFTKKHHTIPYQRVQNVQSHTPFYLRMFQLTSITLETGAESNDASFTFTALAIKEAQRMEDTLDQFKQQDAEKDCVRIESSEDLVNHEKRTIHFNPSKNDILKASVLSFSYLLLIPLLISVFQNINEVYDLTDFAEGTFDFLIHSWLLLTIVIMLVILVAVVFGLVRTYLQYGKYEIASDENRIYIRKGILNEQHFSIRKQNVQAVHIEQSLFKRILHLAEVKLISAGGVDFSGDEVNSLYPFLPTKRAITLIEELLPDFEMKTEMERLPKKSLIVRLCRIPWLWLIVTAILMIWKPEWWIISPILFVLTYTSRILDFYFTRFLIHDEFLQIRSGGFSLTTVITTREKIIEFDLSQSLLKKRLGLATITTTNRGKPIHVETLDDLSYDQAKGAFIWYTGRKPALDMEGDSYGEQ